MVNLSTTYMGLKLKNPIIVGSSGLTNSVENIKEAAANGAAAVVLKSLFEEQIKHSASHTIIQDTHSNYYPEAEDYIRNYTRHNDVDRYLNLIRDAKQAVDIPIIASINCVSDQEWIEFATKIEEAGADGLELNMFILPSDPHHNSEYNENIYFEVLRKLTKLVKIPVSLKISYYFSSLSKMVLRLSWTGISGLVFFNRFFSPDIDIDKFEIKASSVFSHPEEIAISLRWVAMMSTKVHCDIAASTGIHDGKAVIKQLLAGARAVQIASVLYKKGFQEIGIMLNELETWMTKHNFKSTDDFIGRMSVKEADNPAAYERVQFMKHFSGIE
ncbi:MAG: dihydroorotate dehydrogenase-like protein [Bacteroidales bacterium]|jgi:dihydroorotate dehydrogenase (fumarate)|nr:dihydroorotate dehydrogenase-like protein [Bacteroidales bacterium]HOI31451.1 dihydroorotate dehydrogenase-like protein [Bacteroidales bacterium]